MPNHPCIVTNAFFCLLEAGLWEKAPSALTYFPLTTQQWNEVYAMACQQTVRGLVYRGISMLPEHFLPSELQLMQWVAAIENIEHRNARMNVALASLCKCFASVGVKPVVLKGQGCANLYEQPMLRECGDIDLYFPNDDERQKALAVLQSQGIAFKKHADGSLCYQWNGIEVEHHAMSVDVSAMATRAEFARMERDCGFVEIRSVIEDEELMFMIPSYELNYFLQSVHILKHSLGWGIGLRQLCDLARLCYKMHGKYDKGLLQQCSIQVGMQSWAKLVHSFLVEHLGMPESFLPWETPKVSTQSLLVRVLRGGNFGQYRTDVKKQTIHSWKRKVCTAGTFLHNVGYALRYAPMESVCIFTKLVKGQRI